MRTSGTYPEASAAGVGPDIAARSGRRRIRKGRRRKGRKCPGGAGGGSKDELVRHGVSPTCESAAAVCAVEADSEPPRSGAFVDDWILLGLRLSGRGDDDGNQPGDNRGQVDYASMEQALSLPWVPRRMRRGSSRLERPRNGGSAA